MDVIAASLNLSRKAGRRAWALRKPILRWRNRTHRLGEQFATYREEWAVERELERAVGGSAIIAGPWLSEVGYEVLYWIPFLRWVAAAYRIKPDRFVAVSRGGVAGWYADVASRYVEIFDLFDANEFVRRNVDRSAADGTVKQFGASALDADMVEAVTRRLGLSGATVLHPSLMYRLFKPFWSGHRALGFMDTHTRYRRLASPDVVDLTALPREYVAVKFYAATSLPATEENRRLIGALVKALAERIPVVTLDTGLRVDDHDDYLFQNVPGIISARELMTPGTNLGVQTQIIARAKAFVGTCGSVAWLAPLVGTDTMAVLADAKFLHAHLGLARRVYYRTEAARFAPLDLSALGALGLALTAQPTPSAQPVIS